MANVSGKAYGLTIFSPIKNGRVGEIAYGDEVRHRLQAWHLNENSPMAKTPNTYLCRYFVLDDVFYESLPACDFCCGIKDFLSIFSEKFRLAGIAKEDHLKSKYLVFSTNFHGDRDTYLKGMWGTISNDIKSIWGVLLWF